MSACLPQPPSPGPRRPRPARAAGHNDPSAIRWHAACFYGLMRGRPVALFCCAPRSSDPGSTGLTGIGKGKGRPAGEAMASSRDPGDHGGCPELGRGPCCVLVVDDQPSRLGTARGLLTLAGYEAHTASSGADGVRVARSSRPDAILLDVEMPGMDGFESWRRLKGHPATAGIPALFCTAMPDAQLDRRAFEAGRPPPSRRRSAQRGSRICCGSSSPRPAPPRAPRPPGERSTGHDGVTPPRWGSAPTRPPFDGGL